MKLECHSDHEDCESALPLLSERACNVPVGLEVEGVKMKTTEKLVVPLERFSAEQIEQLRGLVGEVWIWNQNLNFGKLRFEKIRISDQMVSSRASQGCFAHLSLALISYSSLILSFPF